MDSQGLKRKVIRKSVTRNDIWGRALCIDLSEEANIFVSHMDVH